MTTTKKTDTDARSEDLERARAFWLAEREGLRLRREWGAPADEIATALRAEQDAYHTYYRLTQSR